MDERRRGEQWEHALDRWKRLAAEERFWSRVQERVVELDDPRVTSETVSRLRTELPLALLAINADLAVRAAERSEVAETDRQLVLMRRWDAALVERAILRALESPAHDSSVCATRRGALANDGRGARRPPSACSSRRRGGRRDRSPVACVHPVRVAARMAWRHRADGRTIDRNHPHWVAVAACSGARSRWRPARRRASG